MTTDFTSIESLQALTQSLGKVRTSETRPTGTLRGAPLIATACLRIEQF